MKKHTTEFIILFIISAVFTFLGLNFGNSAETFGMPDIWPFTKWTLGSFVILTLVYFAKKGKPEKEHRLYISDGFHELYNDAGQTTKKGIFQAGNLYNGAKHVYKKDGTLSHIEIYKEGRHTGNQE